MDFFIFASCILSMTLGIFLGWFLCSLRAKTSLNEALLEKKMLLEKLVFIQEMQKRCTEEFQGLSVQALNQSSDTFLKLATATFEKYQERAKSDLEKKEENIANLMKPVKESLEKFDVKMKDLEAARLGANVSLREQISFLMQSQKELKQETGNLVKALRAPIVRGRWGEIQLRRVVEMAGMIEHCDFLEQETIENEEKKLRPDLLVRLPGNRLIIIDAKAPLEAYLDAIECPDEKSAALKLKDHARHIRQHMTLLSRKSYWENLPATPDFVVLFLPSEAFFSAALEQDPTLIEVGVEQKVILATPTTLIALLKSVAYGWRQEALSKNAEEISSLGSELYKRVGDMALHWAKMGKHLEHTVQSYNQAVGTLESRVLVSARKFRDLQSCNKDQEIEVAETITSLPRPLHAPEMELKGLESCQTSLHNTLLGDLPHS